MHKTQTNLLFTFLLLILILLGCNPSSKKEKKISSSNNEQLESTIDLTSLKAGTTLLFADFNDRPCDSITLEFLENNDVKFSISHVYLVGANPGRLKREYSKGLYKATFHPANYITLDSDYWKAYDSIIILTNFDYGYDNGYNNLYKKYAILKRENKSIGMKTGPEILEWLDPINYPSRNGEYTTMSAIKLAKVKYE